jgi:hypothetical protein
MIRHRFYVCNTSSVFEDFPYIGQNWESNNMLTTATTDEHHGTLIRKLTERHKCILWRVEPLLCNDHEMSRFTMAVSGQQLRKHVPAVTDANATKERLCFLCSVPKCYKQRKRLELSQFTSVRESVKTGLQPGSRGIAIVGSRYQKMSSNRLKTLDCVP